jgi:hypothetical protein
VGRIVGKTAAVAPLMINCGGRRGEERGGAPEGEGRGGKERGGEGRKEGR